MKDLLDRIGKYQRYYESKLRPAPEIERELLIKLGHLANEALERDGQLSLFNKEEI